MCCLIIIFSLLYLPTKQKKTAQNPSRLKLIFLVFSEHILSFAQEGDIEEILNDLENTCDNYKDESDHRACSVVEYRGNDFRDDDKRVNNYNDFVEIRALCVDIVSVDSESEIADTRDDKYCNRKISYLVEGVEESLYNLVA